MLLAYSVFVCIASQVSKKINVVHAINFGPVFIWFAVLDCNIRYIQSHILSAQLAESSEFYVTVLLTSQLQISIFASLVRIKDSVALIQKLTSVLILQVKNYAEWVVNSDYDWPQHCSSCNSVLKAGSEETTRLGCLRMCFSQQDA